MIGVLFQEAPGASRVPLNQIGCEWGEFQVFSFVGYAASVPFEMAVPSQPNLGSKRTLEIILK